MKKTHKMIEAEKEYGKPIRSVIIDLLSKNNNKKVTSELLGIQRQQLDIWIKGLSIEKTVIWR